MNYTIIFDLDGTLITCENKQKFVLYSLLHSFNGFARESLNYWWELKRNGYSTEKALIEMRIPNAKLVANKWINNIEKLIWANLDSPFRDSLPTLEYLQANQVKNIILTARSNVYNVNQVVNRFGFNEHINELIIVNPGDSVKEKERYLKKIKPLVFIGDSELDYLAAANSGTGFIALSRGQRSPGFLKNKGAMQIEEDLKFLNNNNFITRLKKRTGFLI